MEKLEEACYAHSNILIGTYHQQIFPWWSRASWFSKQYEKLVLLWFKEEVKALNQVIQWSWGEITKGLGEDG